jgi:hypothetical protein
MLQVNPKMLARLADVEQDLLARRKRAKDEQWLGEIDGIDMTLTFHQASRSSTSHPAARRGSGFARPRTQEATASWPPLIRADHDNGDPCHPETGRSKPTKS